MDLDHKPAFKLAFTLKSHYQHCPRNFRQGFYSGWWFLSTADIATRNLFCDNQTWVTIIRHRSMVKHASYLITGIQWLYPCCILELMRDDNLSLRNDHPNWGCRFKKMFCTLCNVDMFSIWESKRFILRFRRVLGERVLKYRYLSQASPKHLLPSRAVLPAKRNVSITMDSSVGTEVHLVVLYKSIFQTVCMLKLTIVTITNWHLWVPTTCKIWDKAPARGPVAWEC